MKTVRFILAGITKPSNNFVFFQPKNRMKTLADCLWHRNDYETEFNIPYDFFREHFKYEHRTGIYKTKLTYKDIWQYSQLYCVDFIGRRVPMFY